MNSFVEAWIGYLSETVRHGQPRVEIPPTCKGLLTERASDASTFLKNFHRDRLSYSSKEELYTNSKMATEAFMEVSDILTLLFLVKDNGRGLPMDHRKIIIDMIIEKL